MRSSIATSCWILIYYIIYLSHFLVYIIIIIDLLLSDIIHNFISTHSDYFYVEHVINMFIKML